ncbi:multiubiquitin domain-containing protein [Pseudarthrobacter oxydans]|uniref:multiubiquitin domain-containing protein n=1 Tax=Pseudarthrobacter oxydans TaxID=1671 RepID=UPI0038071E2F
MTTQDMAHRQPESGKNDPGRNVEEHLEEVQTSDVLINNHPVRLPKRRLTGAEIKAAAIAQGVQIDAGFQLWWERANGREQQVGDSDTITTKDGQNFTAVAPDDNS